MLRQGADVGVERLRTADIGIRNGLGDLLADRVREIAVGRQGRNERVVAGVDLGQPIQQGIGKFLSLDRAQQHESHESHESDDIRAQAGVGSHTASPPEPSDFGHIGLQSLEFAPGLQLFDHPVLLGDLGVLIQRSLAQFFERCD